MRDQTDEAVLAAARQIPGFALILDTMSADDLAAESERSRRLERRALLEEDWVPYLENLHAQGTQFANLGVAFRDWYKLLAVYRHTVVPRAIALDAIAARRVLDGMGLFLDIAMAAMGEGYLATKEARIQGQQAVLQRHVRDLERSNKELDDFAFVASHDLKAPLRDIHSLAEWIVEDAGDSLTPDSARHLGLIRERIARMERLLDDLLQYSRAGRIASKTEEFEVRRAVEAAIGVSVPVSGFEVAISGASVVVRTARAPLELVLRNLLGNAVKHHDADAGRIEVLIEDGDEEIAVTVTDDGPGIPAEFHERVFRMFQTLKPRDEVEGSGMGLAIVKKLVESCGGTLALTSSPGAGTSIRFTWPKQHGTGA
ncbi:MAG: ATP-binding protein [Sandaracinaceae bacterium]